MLLLLLAGPLLGLAGVPLRARLLVLAALVAVYVPVAGGGPSIIRAGAMGIAGLVAALASRPRSRWYALLVSALVTLAIDPRFVSDVGWQLSFAAVLGIALLAKPLTVLFLPRTAQARPLRRALAEGAALTIAATLSTAPLIAAHFETVSLTTLPANLVAAPAVAPAMWLGMGSAALGQIPGAPVAPLTWLGGLCAGFIAWAAHVFGSPRAQIAVSAPGPLALASIYTGVALCSALAIRFWRRRSGSALHWRPVHERQGARAGRRRGARTGHPRIRKPLAAGAALLAVAGAVSLLIGRDSTAPPGPEPGLRINFLDVGQGDSILLRTRGGHSLLVDTGPPGSAGPDRVAQLTGGKLDALVLTHDESDHDGGLPAVLASTSARQLLIGQGTDVRACRAISCPPIGSLARGDVLRMGRLSVRVLWPPATPTRPDPAADRNLRALVLLVRWRRFRALLTADAEQGFAPVEPGHVDVLKVAHHASDDPGLDALLDRATPALAVISVGAGNSYGHPTPATLAKLAEHGVETMRTDADGEVEIDVARRRWTVG
jgi:competence protein ComEC